MGRWLALLLGALGLLVVHPPMYGVACAIAAGLALLDGLRSRRLGPAVGVVGAAALLLMIPLALRFVDQPLQSRPGVLRAAGA